MKEQKIEVLDRIREVVGNPGDIVNKAHLFDTFVKKKVEMSLPKVIAILVGFKHKMEAVLGEIRKLIPGSPVESSRLPPPPRKKRHGRRSHLRR